jgi:hypothetical protein
VRKHKDDLLEPKPASRSGRKARTGSFELMSKYAPQVWDLLNRAYPRPLKSAEMAKALGLSTFAVKCAIESLSYTYPIWEEEGPKGSLYGILKRGEDS